MNQHLYGHIGMLGYEFLSNLFISDLTSVCVCVCPCVLFLVFFFFFQIGNLKAHLKIHIADGPLKCRECGKQFTTSGKRQYVAHVFSPFDIYSFV